MHIPDGFLSIEISAIMYVIVIIFWILAFSKSKKTLGSRQVPFLAVIAAAIFAGQMLNFSLVAVGGTSGHLLGAALAAILFGPYGALIVMTLVLVVQALFFADGGIIVLGANILNMGIIGGFFAYYIYKGLNSAFSKSKSIWAQYLPVFISAWLSVALASLVCAIQLGLSGTVGIGRALIAMVPLHLLIGIGEGIITVGIIAFIKKTRPDMLELEKVEP